MFNVVFYEFCIVMKTSFIVGFLKKNLFTIGEYGFTIHCYCRSNTLINVRILNSTESTISTAVPSHGSHALRPYSFFAQPSDFYAVDPLPARNGLACSHTLQITSTLIHTVPPVHNSAARSWFTHRSYSLLSLIQH
jgi:hypothetical protein